MITALETYRVWPENRLVTVNGNLIGAGGEAEIYSVENPANVMKKFHEWVSVEKLKLMGLFGIGVRCPKAHEFMTLPQRIFLNPHDGSARAYEMRLAKGLPLSAALVQQTRSEKLPSWDYRHLIHTARNLAAALDMIHSLYVHVGDISAENFFVDDTDATVTAIDTDSMQFTVDGRLYITPVMTEDTAAPELQGLDDAGATPREVSHDSFSVAILIFQLLMGGAHPFVGKAIGNTQKFVQPIGKCIERGWYCYNNFSNLQNRSTSQTHSFVPPANAPPFELLPAAIQRAFWQTFSAGHGSQIVRTKPATWRQLLDDAASDLVQCSRNSRHYYFNKSARCMWCKHIAKTGIDYFPSPNPRSFFNTFSFPSLRRVV